MSSGTCVFAGGGTGGHIYPGLAIAQRLDPEIDVLFLCSARQIDESILTRAGVTHQSMPARPMSLSPLRFAKFIGSWGPSVRAARAELQKAKQNGPVVVVALGGYVAAPIAQAARVEKCPVVLVNLDAIPGKANRWIARRASSVFSTVELVGKARRDWEIVGPLLRREAIASENAESCRTMLGFDPTAPLLLVTGGSQGARSINRTMAEVAKNGGIPTGWNVLHQSGGEDSATLEEAYAKADVPARVVDSIDEMGVAWGAASLSISRCGAGTVAEALASATPSVFLPFPHHRDDHQRHNARAMVESGGARLVPDAVDAVANATTLRPVLDELFHSPSTLESMRAALEAIRPDPEASALGLAKLVQERLQAIQAR